jgi:uncharacterized membrane protein YoaK (UPF0700 family)
VHPDQHWSTHSNARLAALCFAAGFIDVIGFISVLGVFVGHVTSNLTMAGAAFTRHDPRIAMKLGLLPVFIIAVAAATVINHWARVRRFNPERILLAIEALCLLTFMISGVRLRNHAKTAQATDTAIVGVASLAVFAMGVHNTVTREARAMPTTTAMTANLTQFVMDITDLCVGSPHRTALKAHAWRGGIVIGNFIAGAAIGTMGFMLWQFWSVLLPILLIVVLAITPPAYSPIPVPRREPARK